MNIAIIPWNDTFLQDKIFGEVGELWVEVIISTVSETSGCRRSVLA